MRAALICLVLVVAGVVVWYWMGRDRVGGESGNGNAVQSTLHLDSFVLNAADADQRAYLRVGIDLGLNQDAKHASTAPVARVRDTILGVLGEAKVDDLMAASGKKKLKDDLVRALRERVPELGVEEVYFTEFLIQR
ncbi:MAG TPA: flagellar basal body-associated FliL family protein [Terriglobales bacterium]